jgi:hypothetical protein
MNAMSRRAVISFLLVSGVCLPASGWAGGQKPGAAAETPDASGAWEMRWKAADGYSLAGLDLIQEGEQITGTFTGPRGRKFPITGRIKGSELVFEFSRETDEGRVTSRYTATVSGAEMRGRAETPKGSLEWTATRIVGNLPE